MSAIQITIPTIFAVCAVVMCFFRRMPACLVAYAAYVSAGLLGVMPVPVDQYLIWGFIALITTINMYSSSMHPSVTMHLYTVGGCFVGCLLGAIFGNIAVTIGAGALGAILGFLAFTRTPKGRAMNVPISHTLSLFAQSACNAWFSFTLIAVVLFAVFS